jgi:hypothetical protein
VTVGSDVLTVVEVISTTATVPVGTGLVALQAENKTGRRQIPRIVVKSWRKLIGQIIPVNRFTAYRTEINNAF